MKPFLILLCDSYPLSAGEFFLDDEIKIIHSKFEKIYVLTKVRKKDELCRFVSDNLEVISCDSEISIVDKIKAIPSVFSLSLITEFFRAVLKYKIGLTLLLLKIMYMDIVRSKQVMNEIEKLIVSKKINKLNAVFYSYWHDYRALALARLNKLDGSFVSVSRAHGWDVFAERHNPPFLPFKNFIIENLDKTFSISKAGMDELRKYYVGSNISVSKLGKINKRKALLTKNNDGFLVCSCSNIISLKRLDLIIELISRLDVVNVKWVHFGDGDLRKQIEDLAKEKLSGIEYEFKGIVPNSDILNFYAQNYVDLFINLSESEGIPVSIMEALSAGIPVLATDVGGTSEAVNEKLGFLLPKDFCMDEATKIVNGFLLLPVDEQRGYRERAYSFWKDTFEAEKNYKEFAEDLIRLMPEK